MSLIIDEHRRYLADEARISAFRRAIHEVVRQGDVVVDLGAGTGILGLLACQAGAKRVYVLEETDLIGLTRDIYHANGYDDHVVFIKELSTRVTLPEPADVVVADQIGLFGFDAGIFEYFSDARDRFLKPHGRTIPSRIDLIVVPVESPTMWAQVEFWNSAPAGLSFRPARTLAANTNYSTTFLPEHLLGDPAVLISLDPSRSPAPWPGLTAVITARRSGVLHGIGGWFSAGLSERTELTNSPLAADRINRCHVFFPVERPVPLAPGDVIEIRMSILPADLLVKWDVSVRSGTGVEKDRFSHSTFHGMFLCKESLRKTRPDFVPELSPWGEARRSVLELCDGKKPLREIEREIYARHKNLFRSPQDASKFVCEVTAQYAL